MYRLWKKSYWRPRSSLKAHQFEVNLTDEQLKPAIRKQWRCSNDNDFMKSIEDIITLRFEKHDSDNEPR